MSHIYVSVNPIDKRIGLVENITAQNLQVLWDGANKLEKISRRQASILGSPKFWHDYDPKENRNIFKDDPIYFTTAFLNQVALVDGKERTASDIKAYLRDSCGVNIDEIDQVWKRIEAAFTPEKAQNDTKSKPKPKFLVKEPHKFEFRISNELAAKVKALLAKLQNLDESTVTAAELLHAYVEEPQTLEEIRVRYPSFWEFASELAGVEIDSGVIDALENVAYTNTDSYAVGIASLFTSLTPPAESLDALLNLLESRPTKIGTPYRRILKLICNAEIPSRQEVRARTVIESLVTEENLTDEMCESITNLLSRNHAILQSVKIQVLQRLIVSCPWSAPYKFALLDACATKYEATDLGDSLLDGVALASLLANLEGPFILALAKDPKTREHLAATFNSLVNSSTDSGELMSSIQASINFPQLISEDTLRTATMKAFQNNSMLASLWVDLTQQDLVGSLSGQVSSLVEQVKQKEDELRTSREQEREAREYAAQLNARLGSQANASQAELAGIESSARIDILRHVSEVLASVIMISPSAESVELIRFGLAPIDLTLLEQIAEQVEFNPEIHKDPSGQLRSGEPCTVVCPGFATQINGNQLILRQVLVTK